MIYLLKWKLYFIIITLNIKNIKTLSTYKIKSYKQWKKMKMLFSNLMNQISKWNKIQMKMNVVIKKTLNKKARDQKVFIKKTQKIF